MIKVTGLGHKFNIKDKNGNIAGEKWALRDVNLEAQKGKIIAVLGRNGSGKSTFARHLNGLLIPDKGAVIIKGRNTCDESQLINIRSDVGMIFQNPDNQIVGNTVAEDVGFGPENTGTPTEEIWERIYKALEITDLSGYIDRNTTSLSGGQKQRLAIASAMAMKPECIVMDEATSMLDPKSAWEILDTLVNISRKYGITLIMITHHIDEILSADYVYIMDNGEVKYTGTPQEVLYQVDLLEKLGLETIMPIKICHELGIKIDVNEKKLPDISDVVNQIKPLLKAPENQQNREKLAYNSRNILKNKIISATGLSHSYFDGTKEIKAVDNVSFDIYKGEIVAVVGKTGSGKSTLMQMLNGIIPPKGEELLVCGMDVINTKNLKSLRNKIGFVFQYPEYQLFADTVIKDVMYGPLNFGMKKNEARSAAAEALNMVGLPEKYYEYSPYDLSGGEKKRAAIAGILAYKPELLIMDEPVAGLDPAGRKELFELIRYLNKQKVTIIIVSHDMNDVYELADRLLVMNNGSLVYDGDVEKCLSDKDMLSAYSLKQPELIKLKKYLEADVTLRSRTVPELIHEIKEQIYLP